MALKAFGVGVGQERATAAVELPTSVGQVCRPGRSLPRPAPPPALPARSPRAPRRLRRAAPRRSRRPGGRSSWRAACSGNTSTPHDLGADCPEHRRGREWCTAPALRGRSPGTRPPPRSTKRRRRPAGTDARPTPRRSSVSPFSGRTATPAAHAQPGKQTVCAVDQVRALADGYPEHAVGEVPADLGVARQRGRQDRLADPALTV